MRILVAPTAFKGSFSPLQMANAMLQGLKRYGIEAKQDLECRILPLADGGDGTIESINYCCGGSVHKLLVPGALDQEQEASWLALPDLSLVELASACGIAACAGRELRPLAAHTRGLGRVIKDVICKSMLPDIVVALGGSASTDGGSGCLYELGARFFGSSGREIVPAGASSLLEICQLDLNPARSLLSGRKVRIACDVENPLLGVSGASFVFGSQKGASQREIELLESALAHFAEILELGAGFSTRHLKGSGAAGGTAFGLASGIGADIISGFDWLAGRLNLREEIKNCDLLISGEGRLDDSSLSGKVTGRLLEMASELGKPLILLAAKIDLTKSIDSYFHTGSAGGVLLGELKKSAEFANEEDIAAAVCQALRQMQNQIA